MPLNRKMTILVMVSAVICLLAAGCADDDAAAISSNSPGQNNPAPQQNSTGQTANQPDQNQDEAGTAPDTGAIERSWQSSPHAASFVVDSAGQNNTCAQCHAPVDWQPTMDTIPESCFTCKFELEDPPPYIPEEGWQDIPCNVCHLIDRRDEIQAEVAWLAIAAIDEYEEVASTTELCQKCHLPAETPDGHKVVIVSEIHQDQTCTDCHDAHNTLAACADCHIDLDFSAEEPAGHDQSHADIACVLCHHAGDLSAARDEESNQWQLFDPALEESRRISTSHQIALEVDCARCHFTDNPWQLSPQP